MIETSLPPDKLSELTKTGVLIDLDGTFLTGPVSGRSLWLLTLDRVRGNQQVLPRRSVPREGTEGQSKAGLFTQLKTSIEQMRHSSRRPRRKAVEAVTRISSNPVFDVCIYSGRGYEALWELTCNCLDKHNLGEIFSEARDDSGELSWDKVHLKPSGFSSSEWKVHGVIETAKRKDIDSVIMIENDISTAMMILKATQATWPVGVIVYKTLETSRLVQSVVGVDLDAKENVMVVDDWIHMPLAVMRMREKLVSRESVTGK